MSRRRFLQIAAAVVATAGADTLSAIEPFKRTGAPRLRLSLAAYSFRDSFAATAPQRLDMFRFIDFCAEHGCEGAELTSYYFDKDVSDDVLRQVRRHAFLRGVSVSGTAVGNNFALPAGAKRDQEITDVKKWIDRAAILGAPHIRIFAGAAQDIEAAAARKMCISAIEECAAYAGSKGIFLGLENHGGIVAEADGLIEIVQAVKSPWFGINLDTANFHTEDPYADLARCAPYAVNVQVKSEIGGPGRSALQPADLPRIVALLRKTGYQGFVALEYEAKEDPWKAVPPLLAQLKQLLLSSA